VEIVTGELQKPRKGLGAPKTEPAGSKNGALNKKQNQ
jgi:hypothetical protein